MLDFNSVRKKLGKSEMHIFCGWSQLQDTAVTFNIDNFATQRNGFLYLEQQWISLLRTKISYRIFTRSVQLVLYDCFVLNTYQVGHHNSINHDRIIFCAQGEL